MSPGFRVEPSTLTLETLHKALARHLHGSRDTPAPATLSWAWIGRQDHRHRPVTDRASAVNPATYTGAFGPIRDWFAGLPESEPAATSPVAAHLTSRGDEACQGGLIKIEMHFLPDIYVQCDVCRASATTARRWKSVQGQVDRRRAGYDRRRRSGVLQGSAVDPNQMETAEVGLTYIKVGQSATTLSGGEAQRVKLKELSKRSLVDSLYPR